MMLTGPAAFLAHEKRRQKLDHQRISRHSFSPRQERLANMALHSTFFKAARLVAVLVIACSASGYAATTDASTFPFDANQLSGSWAESYSRGQACAPENLKVRMQLSEDKKQLTIVFDRKRKTGLRKKDHSKAIIIAATAHSLTIQYEDEKRKKKSGQPENWELIVVAPGVYRWRETDWPADQVNIVVGIRCSP
jgi:hypothetical protein